MEAVTSVPGETRQRAPPKRSVCYSLEDNAYMCLERQRTN